MIYWSALFIFIFLFIYSIFKEKRLFRNAIYLVLIFVFLFMGISYSINDSTIITLLIIILYILLPLCLLFISFIFISSGIIAIKKEGLNLSHCLSIIFGLGIWFTFFSILILFYHTKLSTLLRCIIILSIILEIYIIFTFVALFIYSHLYRQIPKNINCHFIIIHGAGLLDGYKVSPLLAGRINKAISIFNTSGKNAKFIVSGGQGKDEKISEALAMKKFLLEKQIPNNKIILEDKSTTTLENLSFSKKIIDKENENSNIIFVTNDYHVFRTCIYAYKIGLKAEGVGSKTALYYWPNAFVREYIAIILQYKVFPLIIFVLWSIATLISLMPF